MRRGLAASRTEAQAVIAAGRVRVGGAPADKAARLVAPGEAVTVVGPRARYVSRGGEKLAAALDRFNVDVTGRVALDAGASTGGFTDCLLQHGAAAVYAVDVGYGQFDPRLRADTRVHLFERTNVRHVAPGDLSAPGGPPFTGADLVAADLSFISLTLVVPVLAGPLLAAGGELVLLVKPQFEAGRAEAARAGGVIRDPDVWRRALGRVASALEAAGSGIMGAMPSPLTGPAGNVEFLLHAGPRGGSAGSTEDRLEAAVAEALAPSRAG